MMKRALIVVLLPFLAGYASLALLPGGAGPSPSKAKAERSTAWAALKASVPEDSCPRCAFPRRAPARELEGARRIGATPLLRPRKHSKAEDQALATLELDIRYRGRRLPFAIPFDLQADDHNLRAVWRPERRRFRALPGRSTLSIYFGELLTRRPLQLSLSAGAVTKAVFALSDELRIFGRVSRAEDWPLDLSFVIRRVEAEAPSPLELGSSPDQVCDDEGGFVFSGLAPGRYLIGYTTDGHCADVLTTVELGEAPLFLDLELPPMPAEQGLDITVLSPAGGPCEDARLRIYTPSGSSSGFLVKKGRRFYLPCPRLGTLVGARIEATHPDYGTARFEEPRGGEPLTVRMPAPASLTVSLKGFDASGIEGPVTLHWFQLVPYSSTTRLVDASGAAVFEALSPGAGLISILAADEILTTTPLELASGAQDLELACPQVARLQVSAPGFPGASVHLIVGRGSRSRPLLSGQEPLVFHNVLHGRHSLKLGTVIRRVTVPGPPVVLRAGETRAWRVRIDDPEGPLARSGLRHDDRVLALDGRPIDDATKLDSRGPRSALVQRASGAREEIIWRTDRLCREEDLLGGTVEPSRED